LQLADEKIPLPQLVGKGGFYVADPIHESDPVHDPEFRAAFEHVDGSIKNKVLKALQRSTPVTSGALSPALGWFLALCMLAAIATCFMQSNGCFQPRESRAQQYWEKQLQERRARPLPATAV